MLTDITTRTAVALTLTAVPLPTGEAFFPIPYATLEALAPALGTFTIAEWRGPEPSAVFRGMFALSLKVDLVAGHVNRCGAEGM